MMNTKNILKFFGRLKDSDHRINEVEMKSLRDEFEFMSGLLSRSTLTEKDALDGGRKIKRTVAEKYNLIKHK
jgi:hypothetical protein